MHLAVVGVCGMYNPYNEVKVFLESYFFRIYSDLSRFFTDKGINQKCLKNWADVAD